MSKNYNLEAENIISENELINKYQSTTTSAEEAHCILLYLWNQYSAFVMQQIQIFFAASLHIDYQDLLQESFLVFHEVLNSFNSNRAQRLSTALLLPLRHCFTVYIARQKGCSRHENTMITHFKALIEENELTGNEDIHRLTTLYNQKYSQNPVTPKSLQKYRDYYLMQDKISFEKCTVNMLPQTSDSTWQNIDNEATYYLVRDYIKKTEGNDRLLLLFLFGFIYSVEIDGCSYSVDQKPHPIGPLRRACFKVFPQLTQYLYENDCIASKQPKALLYFLTHFTIPDIEDPDFIPL